MNNNIKILSMAIVAMVIVSAGLFFTKEEKPKEEIVSIRKVDSSTTVNSWEIVKKLTGRDILEEEGVKLELIYSIPSGGPASQQAVLANNLDVATGATLVWLNTIAAGAKVKGVVGNARSTKEHPAVFFIVLNDSNIYGVEDFKGKKIAFHSLGVDNDYFLKAFLKEKGMSINQVEVMIVPGAEQEQVLRSKQVDVITVSDSKLLAMKKRGVGVRVIVSDNDLLKRDYVKSFDGFREDFIEEHPDTVRRYVTAFEKSQRLVWEEFQKDPQKIKKIAGEIIKEKGGNPDVVDYLPIWSPSTPFAEDEDVQLWIDLLVEDGKLKSGQIKPSDVYTNEFNPYYKEDIQKKRGT